MELLSATQALDLLKPLKPASAVLAAYEVIRGRVPFAAEDRVFAKDVAEIRTLVRKGHLLDAMVKCVGDLEW